MDKIIIKNLAFYGYHGVLNEERALGQKFFIDLELFCDLRKAGKSDDVKDTVDYSEVYKIVKKIVEEDRYNLLEALGEKIAAEILMAFSKVEELKIVIRKPGAPINGIFDYFAVEIRRKRDD